MGHTKSERGFTLIETVLVIALLGILAGAILLYFIKLGGSGDQVLVLEAAELAQAKMEDIIGDKKSQGFSYIINGNYPLEVVSNFTRTTNIYFVDEGDLDAEVVGPTDWKRVEVNVSWPIGGGGTIGVVTVVSNH